MLLLRFQDRRSLVTQEARPTMFSQKSLAFPSPSSRLRITATLRVTDCSEKPLHLTTGLLRSAMSLFDPFQEFLIILLFDPVGLFRAPTEPANILGNLLNQSNHVGLIF
jgi:hypothetical protein